MLAPKGWHIDIMSYPYSHATKQPPDPMIFLFRLLPCLLFELRSFFEITFQLASLWHIGSMRARWMMVMLRCFAKDRLQPNSSYDRHWDIRVRVT